MPQQCNSHSVTANGGVAQIPNDLMLVLSPLTLTCKVGPLMPTYTLPDDLTTRVAATAQTDLPSLNGTLMQP